MSASNSNPSNSGSSNSGSSNQVPTISSILAGSNLPPLTAKQKAQAKTTQQIIAGKAPLTPAQKAVAKNYGRKAATPPTTPATNTPATNTPATNTPTAARAKLRAALHKPAQQAQQAAKPLTQAPKIVANSVNSVAKALAPKPSKNQKSSQDKLADALLQQIQTNKPQRQPLRLNLGLPIEITEHAQEIVIACILTILAIEIAPKFNKLWVLIFGGKKEAPHPVAQPVPAQKGYGASEFFAAWQIPNGFEALELAYE